MLSAEIFRVLYDKNDDNDNDGSPIADSPAVETTDDKQETDAPAGVILDDDPEGVQPPIPDENTGGGDAADEDDEANFY